jgi:ABC-type sugar transport system ATPase subunit
MPESFLEFRNVRKSFGATAAVDDVSIAAPRGHIRAILGENGAGKSTLVKMLCGVYPPDSGDILVEGRRVDDLSPAQALAAGIVAIYQEFNLVPQLTVAQNIFLGRFPVRGGWVDTNKLRSETEAILRRLSVSIDPDAPVGALSVAEQQIVEIAKALSRDLKILVMDEPTAALNDAEVGALFSVIRGLRERGVCVLYISHRMSEIFALADSVSVLKDGRHVGTHDIAEVDRDTLVRMMIGRELGGYFPPRGKPAGDVILVAESLRASGALNVARLEIRRGEIVGLAGLEGQGQRRLVRALCGAFPLDAGEVTLDGARLDLSSPRATIAAGVGYIPDDRKGDGLALMRSCRENIAIESLDRRRTYAFFVDEPREAAVVREMVVALGIRLASPRQNAQDLSGGNQQKLVLAKVLGIQPKVMILAEPTRGVDVGAKREIYNIMRELADRGVGLLMMSGELPEILGMSDRILVMAHGAIVADLRGDEATEEMVMQAATREPLAAGIHV